MRLFAIYWQWVADWLAHAFDTGVMWTPFGWECRTGITEFNARSIANFPVQASAPPSALPSRALPPAAFDHGFDELGWLAGAFDV